MLVGTNADLRDDQQAVEKCQRLNSRDMISFEEGQNMAKEIVAAKYLECSARSTEGVKMVFDEAIRAGLNVKIVKKPGVFSRLFGRKDKKEDDEKGKKTEEPKHRMLPEDEEEFNPSELKKGTMIGHGAVSIVYKGEYRGKPVAIKESLNQECLSPEDLSDFKREVRVLKEVRHEAIVKFIGAIETGILAVVLEYCPYGSLYSAMKQYPDKFNDYMKVKCLMGKPFDVIP